MPLNHGAQLQHDNEVPVEKTSSAPEIVYDQVPEIIDRLLGTKIGVANGELKDMETIEELVSAISNNHDKVSPDVISQILSKLGDLDSGLKWHLEDQIKHLNPLRKALKNFNKKSDNPVITISQNGVDEKPDGKIMEGLQKVEKLLELFQKNILHINKIRTDITKCKEALSKK